MFQRQMLGGVLLFLVGGARAHVSLLWPPGDLYCKDKVKDEDEDEDEDDDESKDKDKDKDKN